MRKAGFLCLLLLVLVLPLNSVRAVGQNGVQNEELNYENNEVEEKKQEVFQNTPFVDGQQTFVPLRELGSLLGFHVGWDMEKGQVKISSKKVEAAALPREDNKLIMQVLSPEYPGGSEEPLLWEYRKENGHIFVPLRPVARLFSWRIGWDEENWNVSIWTEDFGKEDPALVFHVEQRILPGEDPGKKSRRVAYLTFDDGPSKKVTPSILDVLKEEEVPATFFVTGLNAKEYPDIIHRTHKEGHTIGNHTYSHRASIIYTSPEAFMQEVQMTENIIYDITAERTRILRAPYGSYPHLTAPFRQALTERGYQYVDWNVDSMDSREDTVPAKTIVNAIKRQVPGKDQVFILFHDLPAKTTTARALPDVISFLRENNYTFKALTHDTKMITHW